MKFRYKIEEISKPDHPHYFNDAELIIAILNERLSDVSNIYSPLAKRLRELRSRVEDKRVSVNQLLYSKPS